MSGGMNFTMDISTQMNMIMIFSYFIYILLAMMKLTMTMIQCMSDDRFPELNFIIDHICINCWLPAYKKSIFEKQVASKINGVV